MEYQSLNSFILPSLKIASRYSSYSHHLDSLKRSRKLDVFYSHLNYFFIKIRITRELFVSRRDKRLELNRSRLKIVLYFNFEKENTFHNRTIIHLYPDSTFRSSLPPSKLTSFQKKFPFAIKSLHVSRAPLEIESCIERRKRKRENEIIKT